MNYEKIALWSEVLSSFAFLAVLIWGFRKFMIPAIISQQEQKNADLATAERRRDEAKASIAGAQAELSSASSDAQDIRARTQRDVEHERQRLLVDAREQGERAVRNAEGELGRARTTARDRLRIEMIEKALQLARRKADEQIDAAANAELVERFVGTIERDHIGEDRG